jgi:hypothetical protein
LKADPLALGLRLGTALFLWTLIVAALYLIGAAQSFYEATLLNLFLLLRWLAWAGMAISWLVLAPWARRLRRTVAAVVLGIGFGLVFVFVLLWGAWVYPQAGAFLW